MARSDSSIAGLDPLHRTSGPETTWTRVNMAEGIPGVQTPLSWSFWDDSLDTMMREGYRVLGVIPAFEAPPATDVDKRLVTICFGRSALNVDLFREIADATPWTSSEAFNEYYFGMARTGEKRRKQRRRYPIVFARTLPVCLRVHRQIQQSNRETRRWWAAHVTASARSDVHAAPARLREAHERFVRIGSAHSAAAQIAGAICNMLTKLCAAAGRPELIMTLLGGHESVEVETTLDLWKVAREGLPMEQFILRHGFQGPLMGELSSPCWREDASPVARLLGAYESLSDEMNPRFIERRRVEERESAERELLSALGPPERAAARAVFSGLHAYIPCRELGKASMMMAFDVARAAARALGGDLVRKGVIEAVEDVFYLTMPELLGSLPAGAKDVIAQRRTRRAQYETLELPDTWVGEPTPKERRPAGGGPVPSGIGVSPGVVRGRARVIRDIGRDAHVEPGEILVCETTDPSWAAYFLVAAGVVTDIGGSMSHGAIVSREVGIPCVVNTKTGTNVLRTGDLIEIDGTTGEVEVLESGGGRAGSAIDARETGDRPTALPRIVDFDDPQLPAPRTRALELGGKGANLAEMTSVLELRVPPGFTITTAACRELLSQGTVSALRPDIRRAVQRMEEKRGQGFGDERTPLLLSVRSGAPVSMPGMMDTVLNLGITPETVHGLARRGGEAFAWSCYRSFIEMYASTVLGRRDDVAGRAVGEIEREHGALGDRLDAVAARLETAGIPVPVDPWDQLMAAVEAIVASWNSERAITYRRVEGIDDDLCTAVNVQCMVFGNLGPDSGAGVAFTRHPSTGAAGLVGDYLSGAQGEDVVAGTHRVEPLSALAERAPNAFREFERVADKLERHYGDMCDIEFTIERGVLWLLQVRVGKRSRRAALRVAIDLARDPAFPLDRRDAVTRVLEILARPPVADRPLDGRVPSTSLVRGVGASPGVASGRAWLDPAAVVEAAARGERAVLVRAETSPADVHGMADAVAVLTARGGMMSHAAVVARSWDKPAVVGVERLEVFDDHAVLSGTRIEPGDWLTVDGSIGAVVIGRIETESEPIPEVDTLLRWAAELGIEIAPAPSDGGRSAPAATETATRDEGRGEDELAGDALVVLAIRRQMAPADLAQALGVGEERLAPLLERQRAAGHLDEPSPRGLQLSEVGALRAAELFANMAGQLGPARGSLLESFERPNRQLKAIVTDWQLIEIDGERVPNPHDDAEYDAGVIGRLRDLHAEMDRWLAGLPGAAPLIELFRRRLGLALDRIVADDPRWLVSPFLDSYHTVWFELHECLLRLAGRSRSEEAKAGRAS